MSNRVHIVKPDTGADTVVATESNQQELIDAVNQSVSTNSSTFGTEKITIDGDGLGIVSVPTACREVWVTHQVSSNDVHLAIQDSGDADANDFLLPPNVVIKVPIRNTSQIRLFGTAADLVYLMWRN